MSQGGLNLVSDVQGVQDERRFQRTAKPCGPDTRCWCQAGGGARTQLGFVAP
jgi:hypothetical protein